ILRRQSSILIWTDSLSANRQMPRHFQPDPAYRYVAQFLLRSSFRRLLHPPPAILRERVPDARYRNRRQSATSCAPARSSETVLIRSPCPAVRPSLQYERPRTRIHPTSPRFSSYAPASLSEPLRILY